jgi:DNA helicase II / ATP-dependent DNA helicase PcrA
MRKVCRPEVSPLIATLSPMSPPPAPRDLLASLNPAQRRAAEAVHGPVVILAGAGTGKTRTITHRIANQIVQGAARPSEILAVTFTDRAARELRERLAALGLPTPVRAATFHAAAWAQLRYFWPLLSDGPRPEVMPSKLRIIGALARRRRIDERDAAAEVEWAKARRLTPETYVEAAADRDTPLPPADMAALYAEYEHRKDGAGLIDYDDMILRTTDAILTDAEVAHGVRSRYRFFTVDEFQDVNPAQYALLQAWLGDGEELCVVGDDDQTIYRFNGAAPEHLTGFRRAYPTATTITLTESYRSTDEVLALANAVLWTKPAHLRKELTGRQGSGPPPAFMAFADDDAEVEGVVARIAALTGGRVRGQDAVAPREIAICYRVNSHSEPYEQALRDVGIPYVVRGEGGFFERTEIRQAIGLLRAAVGRDPQGSEDPAALPGTAPSPKPADRVVERVLREQAGWSPKKEPAGESARERWRNLGALHALVGRLVAADAAMTFADVVNELEGRAAAGHDAPTDGGAVTLLTLHRAKGLEFDAVFIVGVEEGLLPISHAKTDEEVEEERRLLYVGITRARRHLWLSWTTSRTGRTGRTSKRTPSRFLYNLGPGAPVSTKGKASSRTCRCGRPLISAADRRQRRCATCAGGTGAAGPVDPELEERLRAWRRERSSSDGVPAYIVFNDKTLADLAAVRPSSPEELLDIRGFGPAKLERYGDDVLAVVRG